MSAISRSTIGASRRRRARGNCACRVDDRCDTRRIVSKRCCTF